MNSKDKMSSLITMLNAKHRACVHIHHEDDKILLMQKPLPNDEYYIKGMNSGWRLTKPVRSMKGLVQHIKVHGLCIHDKVSKTGFSKIPNDELETILA